LPEDVDEALVGPPSNFSAPNQPAHRTPQEVADGGMPQYGVKGFIAPQHQAQPGKALCVWGDAGWGGLVREASTTTASSPMTWLGRA
jgi:ATP-dependent DNA helicase RecQ